MVCFVVEYVILLAVSVFVLDCPWCTVEAVGEGTSGMNVFSWWDRVVEVCVGN